MRAACVLATYVVLGLAAMQVACDVRTAPGSVVTTPRESATRTQKSQQKPAAGPETTPSELISKSRTTQTRQESGKTFESSGSQESVSATEMGIPESTRTVEPSKTRRTKRRLESKAVRTPRTRKLGNSQDSSNKLVPTRTQQSTGTRLSNGTHQSNGTRQSNEIYQSNETQPLIRTHQSTKLSLPTKTRQSNGTQQSDRRQRSAKTRQSTRTRQSTGAQRSNGTQQSTSTRLSTETKRSNGTHAAQTKSAGTTSPDNETLVYFTPEDMVKCVLGTRVTSIRPFGVSSIYKEIFGRSGTVSEEGLQSADVARRLCKRFPSMPACIGDYRRRRMACSVKVQVPEGMFIVVEMVENAGCQIVLHNDRQSIRLIDDFSVATDKLARTQLFIGYSNYVTVTQKEKTVPKDMPMRSRTRTRRLVFRFLALSDRHLQVMPTGFNRGVVQTPLFQDLTDLISPLADQHAHVMVPSGHVIMFSSPRFDVTEPCFALYDGGVKPREVFIRSCQGVDQNYPRAYIRNITMLTIHLYTYAYEADHFSNAAFQLFFSFHNQTALPMKLSDNTWNCSVPYRADFLYHLSCDLEAECLDAEDELDCFYTTELCGPGYLTLGGACFFYERGPEKKKRWHDASVICKERGGRLASLSTEDKWWDYVTVVALSPYMPVKVFVGLRSSPFKLEPWYRGMFQWLDETMAFNLYTRSEVHSRACGGTCGKVTINGNPMRGRLSPDSTEYCASPVANNVLCERPFSSPSPLPLHIFINDTDSRPSEVEYTECPGGHYTHRFLACDVKSSCWSSDQSSQCESSPRSPSSLTSLPFFFTCTNELERIPHDLVCNHLADCVDKSDEDFCTFPPCGEGEFSCYNGQCIPYFKLCNGWEDCQVGEDETSCASQRREVNSLSPPAVVVVSDEGLLTSRPLNASLSTSRNACPRTHFRCRKNGYCLPVFLHCNGVYDCPAREDETGCDSCPGFYRCRDSTVCLHYSDLCDGHDHCPQHDDELMCDLTCPSECVCRGLAFFCSQSFPVSAYPLLRYLDASGSAMTPEHLTENLLLINLTLANCSLTHLDNLTLPNLISLDIQNNQLSDVGHKHLVGVPHLRQLSVANNPLTFLLTDFGEICSVPYLQKLDLSRVVIRDFNVTKFTVFPSLHVLNLSNSGVQHVQEGFRKLEQLRVIDLRGCPMTWFPREVFLGLGQLQKVYADTFKICCPVVLPVDFNLHSCFAPSDVVSSCENLLRGETYRACVFVLSLFALVGNSVSFVFRICLFKRGNHGFENFVTHLSVADFLMGVYLVVIGVADQVYHKSYLWNDLTWKNSVSCKLGGFLSLLSSEVSALIVCLITIDRFLVLRFPFSQLQFSSTSANMASLLVWIGGVSIALVPLLPVTSHWEFYGQTGICIPLPIITADFVGKDYAFAVLIVFNFIVFVVISIGQLGIYWSIRANSMSVSNTTKKIKDLSIARRLITVAMTDFLCWFPIGVLGLLASNGVPISGEVNVAAAIFVLPLNSAVNPCLYTVNVILERRTRARVEKLRTALLVQLKAGR